VYSWVTKYNDKGVKALKDNRGRGKSIEDMDKVERLEAENKLLKAKLERLEIEVELKKKLEEIQMHLAYTTKKKK
jgi:transposase